MAQEASEQLEPGRPAEVETDAEPEHELDPEVAARRAAALSRVRKFGDPVLKTRARPVEKIDDALRSEIMRMGELMNDALGVGLAATQVGVLHRLLVYRVQQQSPVAALINPEIEWRGKEEEIVEEGCLSLPAVLVEVAPDPRHLIFWVLMGVYAVTLGLLAALPEPLPWQLLKPTR